MPLQIVDAPGADAVLVLAAERLGHGAQKLLGARDGHVGAQAGVALQQGLADPFRQLRALFLEPPVRQHHDAVVVFAAQHPPQALRRVPHRVEGEEVVFPDPVRLPQECESGFEDAGLGVLEGNADAEHRAAVMVVEIDALGDFSARDAEQDGTPAVAARCAVRLERE